MNKIIHRFRGGYVPVVVDDALVVNNIIMSTVWLTIAAALVPNDANGRMRSPHFASNGGRTAFYTTNTVIIG